MMWQREGYSLISEANMPPPELAIPFLVRIRVWGERACFTRPEMKVERVSYDVITPSAARGILEAIYWKPQIAWRIDRIHVLNPIQFTSIKRNEVSTKVSDDARRVMRSGQGQLGLYADEDRQQRATMLLRDVDYVIEAHFDLVDRSESPAKHFDIARRRIEKGQAFHQPYLGCREFPASFEWVQSSGVIPPPADTLRGEPRDLGYMLHDIDHAHGRAARFFRARMVDGVIDVPPWGSAEVLT
jgi:CRISPR-associated protein Cas5d